MLNSAKFIDIRLFAGIASSSGVSAQLSQICLPLLVSAVIIGLNMNEQNAGLLSSIELITIALVSFCLAPKINIWPRRTLALAGACVAIGAHVFSGFATEVQFLVALRILAGVGAGFMMAAGNACVTDSDNPDRMYSLVIIAIGLAHLILLNIMPVFVTKWSYSGAYVLEAIVIILLIPFIRLLPQHGKVKANTSKGHTDFPLPAAIVIVLMIGLFFSRETALYAFSQEIGLRTGLSHQEAGSVLGIAGLLSLVGATIAAVISTRYGRLIPLLIGLIINTVMPYMISQTNSATVFTICQITYHMALFFTVPYLFGMAAQLDPQGRLMAVAGGSLTLGGACGPGIGGILITWAGYKALGGFILVSMALVTILAVLMNNHLNKNIPNTEPAAS